MDIFFPLKKHYFSKNITSAINCMEDGSFDYLFTWKKSKSNT